LATPQKEIKKELPTVVDIAYEQYKRDLPGYKTTRDIMSPNVVSITPDVSLDNAAQLMGEKHIGSLIITNYKTPVGIVTERDLLSKVLAFGLFLTDEKVSEIMSYPLSGVSVDATIKEVAQEMTRKKGRLAVYAAGTLVGVVTASDLIKSLPDVAETEAKIDDFMTKNVVTTEENTSVINTAKIMGLNRIGSVIITRQGEPFGIFTERDLLTNFLAKGRDLFFDVGPECSKPINVIPAGSSVHRTAASMALKHIRRLPVIKDEKIVGIITARDLVAAYAK
jgi:CBS domain-containing protein